MRRAFVRQEHPSHTMSALVCGLDVHKDSTYATILDCDDKIVNAAYEPLNFVPDSGRETRWTPPGPPL